MKRTFIDKLNLGYRFDRDREVISLLYICYFIIVLFAFVIVLLHTSDEELVLVSHRYHSIVMLCLILVWLIRNNGPAIPEDEIGKIFDPFYTLKGDGKGKGLGMAISYMIVSEHQGWIEARNEGDSGV